jgi:UDP-N-acetylmuramoylalanine--D-glutamate ligase
MKTLEDLKGKKMALAGFGAEGRGTADFLLKVGADVEVFDSKPEEDFPQEVVSDLRERGAVFHFGSLGPFGGFDAVVRSPGISPHIPEFAAAAEQGTPITSATKIFFDLCPCPIVGVTGTKGKGTTSSILHQILLEGGGDAYLGGNIGTPALEFLEKLTPNSTVIYELSSFQLIELDKSPKLAIVLMITNDHLDFHSTTKEYIEAKANILKFQDDGDSAIVNIDYPASRAMAELTSAEVFAVSRKEKVEKGAYLEKNAIMLALGDKPERVMDISDVPLAGPHNLENVCAAILAAALLGAPREAMVKAVREYKPLPHRLELVRDIDGIKYYDDSISTTPESASAALRSFGGPKVIILGGSGKGAEWDGLAADIVADTGLAAIIGIGEEWPRIKEAIKKAGKRKELKIIEGHKSMKDIVRAATEAAPPGSAVILSPACASFDMFKGYKDRGEQFAAAVRALPETK